MIAVPGPSTIETLPYLPALFHDRLRLLKHLKAKWGDIVRLNVGCHSRFIVYHPDMIKHVLVMGSSKYCKGKTFTATNEYLGTGISTAEGASWRDQRRCLNPYFDKSALAAINGPFHEELERQFLTWRQLSRSGAALDLSHHLRLCALSLALRCLFGVHLDEREQQEFAELMEWVLDYSTYRSLVPVAALDAISLPYHHNVIRLRTIAKRIMQESASSNGLMTPFFAQCAESLPRCPFASTFASNVGVDNVINLLFGATDTVSNTMAWLIYNICLHDDVRAAVLEEISSLTMPALEDYTKLNYLNSCVKETLRLYPQNWLMSRDTIEDDFICGYKIPAGSTVYMSVYSVQRSREFWETPSRFDPHRFSPDNPSGHHPFAYLPFGAGQRKCIGTQLAMAEIVLTCAKLFSQFDVALKSRGQIAPVIPHVRCAEFCHIKCPADKWSLMKLSQVSVRLCN